MKKITNYLRMIPKTHFGILFFVALMGVSASKVNAQTQLISASDGGFENATSTFAANGWTEAQPGITRQWHVGTAGVGVAGGTKAAYVGSTGTFNGSTTAGTWHFYRDVVIPTGATNVYLNYYLKMATIDAGNDKFYVFTTTPASTPVSGTLPGAGYTQQFENDATAYSTFTAMPQVDLSALAGTTVRLVFTFVNSAATPRALPAVDNVTISMTPPVCSGTPAPGNTLSTLAAVCTGVNFTLSLQNALTSSGLTYQWQASTDGINYTDIAGATNTTLTTTETATTYYQCNVTCAGVVGTSTPLQVTLNTGVQCLTYCTPVNSTGCTAGDEITNVTFAGINNTTGCSGTGGYNDYTSISGNVVLGTSYPITIVTGIGNIDPEGVAVWIDYNQNGIFETTEYVYNSYSGNDPATYNGTIAIPLTALTGATRMRVRCDFLQAPLSTDPCTVFTFGETEDYYVNITPLTPCSGTPAPGATQSTLSAVCNGVSFTLSLPAPTTSGITYQWQSSPTNSGFTNIAGATSATLTTSQSAATYYQCVVTCTSSTNSANSTPLQVTMTTLCNYCIPVNSTGCTSGDEITNVTFAGINNTTGCSGTGGYNDYTSISGNVVLGTSYPITIVTGIGNIDPEGVAVWIDYNQNGIFETTEYVYNSYSGNDPATYNGTIAIPLTALTGATRMRVRCDFLQAPLSTDPCTVFTYGETEDYTINITSNVATIDMGVSAITAPTVHCYTSTETVSATVNNFSGSTINFATNPVTVNCTVTGANPNNTTFTPIVLNTGTLAAGATQTVTFSTAYNMSAAGTYVITSYTSVTGDVLATNDTARATFTRAANPTVTATPSLTPICAGNLETLTGGGATSYVWTGGVTDGLAFAINTTATYTVTGTDANGCTNTATATITVNQLPTVSATPSLTPICAGSSETLTGGGAVSYVWTGGVTNGTAFNATTTTTYTVTGTDVNSCTNTATTTVTVNQIPTVIANASAPSVCIGSNETLTGSGATSYVWSSGVTDGVAFPAAATATYTVTGTDVNTCTNTATVTVTVNQLPTVTANASVNPICAGNNETLTGGGATSYSWTGGVTDGTAFPVNAAATYTVTGTDGNTCTNTATVTVTITPVPTIPVAILGRDTLCGTNTSIFYVAAVSGATSYTWTLPSGWVGTSTTDSITVSSVTVGGTVTVTANNTCGNSTAQTVNVFIGSAPVQPSSILGVTHLCDSSSTAYAVTNDPNATSYIWTLPTGWSGTSTISSITATASTSSGVITVTANNACGSSTASTLNVFGNAIPVVTVSSFGTVCQSAGAFALTGGSPTGGTYSGTGVNSNNFDPSIAGLGTFMITYTYTSGACVRSDSASLIVDLCTGINGYSNNGNVTIYPNPTNGMFTIHISNAEFNEMQITVVDISGREVYKLSDKNIGSDYNKQISLERVAKGIYYIKMNYGGETSIQKLIIE